MKHDGDDDDDDDDEDDNDDDNDNSPRPGLLTTGANTRFLYPAHVLFQ